MNIVFAAGGTAGHINPALAIAGEFKHSHPECHISFIGKRDGMEQTLVGKAGYDFYPIDVSSYSRSISLKGLQHNTKTFVNYFNSSKKAKQYLKTLMPDLVVGTGGYVCAPVISAAAKMGIKTALHESNAFAGMATKMLAPKVDLVMLGFCEARERLSKAKKIVVTGTPVRSDIKSLDKLSAREELGIDQNKFMILSFGGSLGAKRFNEAITELMVSLNDVPHYHYHAAGKSDFQWMPLALTKSGIDLAKQTDISLSEYIYNMEVCIAASDLLITRSGASTICEIEAAGKPSILIPSPNVTDNHQYHNAVVLEKRDGAVVIEESNLTNDFLLSTVRELMNDRIKLEKMATNVKIGANLNANTAIYAELLFLMQSK